ncbi:DUF554 domain-containing protein [Alkalitalea saponilacus]|uniref:DUF554 domain-containing protein n=1 Tax=Alkalitalea saponilacus TaxID=889453 RepID=A0A1T5HTW1_9BACT|nr:DUF554 domain-containing protein [Alkalitalea saponilacus]ASB50227.1 hypothetical protein CDL62_14310 [Alkalitalea saponilacus]SKC24128.1 hypothetical protein SAMN03080601_03421 [Alkalitalea saponilacus]
MTGTLINVAAVIVGSIIGLTFKKKLPQKVIDVVFQGIGLVTFCIGVFMFLKSEWLIVVVLSLLFGGITGGLLDINLRVQQWSNRVKARFSKTGGNFSEGLTTAFLLYCMGAMAILGALDEGLGQGYELLLTKSVLDGFSSIALSSALGIGVLFSAIPLFLFQGGITLFAIYFGDFANELVINEVSATGGVLLCGLALNILQIVKVRVMDLLPALLYAVIFAYICSRCFA